MFDPRPSFFPADIRRLLWRFVPFVALLGLLAGCATMPLGSLGLGTRRNPESDITALRKQLEDAHASRDVAAFGALHTENVVLEWRGRSKPVLGRAALEASQREIWSNRRELQLNLVVAELHVHEDRAYEFGSYEESWLEPQGGRVTEFGRYVTTYWLEADNHWRIARNFGYSDLMARNKARD